MGRLAGKAAFITAAGAGIGRSSALAFAKEGARVVATDINGTALEALKAECSTIETLPLDVSDRQAINEAAALLPDTDILFNVAGWVHHGSILDCGEDAWDRSIALNLSSMYRLARAFLPEMLTRQSGVILNMSSVASSVTGVPNRFAYGTSKAGVIGLTKAIAADFVAHGIRCNAICPGTVDSPSLQGRMRALGDYEATRAAFVARQPMGRLGRPDEIAKLAVYLASDEASFTTGAIHVIDGGWTA